MIKLHGLMRQPVFRLSRITAHTSAPATPSMQRSISTTAQQCQAVVQNLTVSELYKTLREEHFNDPFRKNLRLIDTRERHEIESFGRIESAVNLPYGLLKKEDPIFSAALEDFDKNVKTVFHCMSGRRSEMVAQHAIKLGFKNVYNLVGGFKEWQAEKLPVLPYENNHSPWVHTIFEKETETAQYIVTDVETKEAYIIDPVLDYDPFSATVRPSSAKQIIDFVTKHSLNVTKIIDTHVHADHLTAAIYLKENLPSKPQFWIGGNVKLVQQVFREKYNLPEDQLPATGEQFDHLVNEGNTWTLGENIHCSVLSTPGHTPACMSYRIGDAAFVGDTLFMPDIGTARCDFPGGSAEQMYHSIHKMYQNWPNDTRIFVGHDYPPATSNRSYEVVTTLAAHKESNKMISESTPMEKYIALRKERDSKLKAPRYIHPSLQTNLRGGHLPSPEKSKGEVLNDRFFKIPVRWRDD